MKGAGSTYDAGHSKLRGPGSWRNRFLAEQDPGGHVKHCPHTRGGVKSEQDSFYFL